ncbi:protein translocase subunit secE/sec61 gamma [Caminicella sporogenes DSM 14501]|uniref:Protein translocase subunit SecE n=1 Tax=Caminicella sporogenes DSM 14501 TaxID=1121266 RepID=A0A1M6TJM8_9FIRM|nr:preprotein translocase subunit SecE [Caminicella sporogenes]RKD24840.1 preprotein translocase subunit SecE [Caminicella sporogenes]WIF95607.1 preprotein translocase subunit SecE [Caminicella sporogenes]SHK57113.1 protein translocase subunit secE/sec61 gamma [Caminicella sporogenes DSM 14501]
MGTQANAPKKVGVGKFLKSVRAELKKVNWPNKQELKSYTGVVLATCGLAALGIWIADSIFGQILKFLIR